MKQTALLTLTETRLKDPTKGCTTFVYYVGPYLNQTFKNIFDFISWFVSSFIYIFMRLPKQLLTHFYTYVL